MRLNWALWAFFYSLVQGLGCLRPNFLHRFHGVAFRQQQIVHEDFHVAAVAEFVIILICFLYAKESFPTTEVIHRIRESLNDETEAMRYLSLRSGFDSKMKTASEALKSWEKMSRDLRAQSVDMSLDESEREWAKDRLGKLLEACEIYKQLLKDLTALHESRDEETEPFVPDFFSLKLQAGEQTQKFYEHIRRKSVSLASRSGANYRWRFNCTRKMQIDAIDCLPAIVLISEYEKFLLESSAFGKIHWVFDRVKAVLLKYNNRTLDVSKFSNVVRTRKTTEVENEDDDIDDPTWGLKEGKKEKKPGGPIKAKRTFSQDLPLRSERLYAKDPESPVPEEYATWFSKNMSEDVLAFFDVAEVREGVTKYKKKFTVDNLKSIREDDLECMFKHFREISKNVVRIENGKFKFISIPNCICMGAYFEALHRRDPLSLSEVLKKLLHDVNWQPEPQIDTSTFGRFSERKSALISSGIFRPFENDQVPEILVDSIAYKFVSENAVVRKEDAFQNIFSDHVDFSCGDPKRYSKEMLAYKANSIKRDGTFYYDFSLMSLRFYLENLGEFDVCESCLFCDTRKLNACETWETDPELCYAENKAKVARVKQKVSDNQFTCAKSVLCECGKSHHDPEFKESSSVVCSCCIGLFRFPEAKNCAVFESWLKETKVPIEMGLNRFFIDVPTKNTESETKFTGLVVENISVDSRKLARPSIVRLISFSKEESGYAHHSQGVVRRREVKLCTEKFCLHDHPGCPWYPSASDCACEKFCDFKLNFFECPQCRKFYSVFGESSEGQFHDWSRAFSLCLPLLLVLVPFLAPAGTANSVLCIKNFSAPRGGEDEILSDRLWKYMFKACRDLFYAEQKCFTASLAVTEPQRDFFLPWRNRGRNVVDLLNGCTFTRTLSTFKYPRILILLAGSIMKSFFNVCGPCVRACGLAVDMHVENRSLLQHEHREFKYDCALCREIWVRSFSSKLPCDSGHEQFKTDCFSCRQIYESWHEGPVGRSLPQLSPFCWTEEMKNVQKKHAVPMSVIACHCGPLFCFDSLRARSQLFQCGATNVERDFRKIVREEQHFPPEKRFKMEKIVENHKRTLVKLQDDQLSIWIEACADLYPEIYVTAHKMLFGKGKSIEQVFSKVETHMNEHVFYVSIEKSVSRIREKLSDHEWARSVVCFVSKNFRTAEIVQVEEDVIREPTRKTRRLDDPCMPDMSCSNASVSKNQRFNPLRSAWAKYQPECGGLPEKFIPMCFNIVRLVLAFVGFDQFEETVSHRAYYGRFLALNQFNFFDRIMPGAFGPLTQQNSEIVHENFAWGVRRYPGWLVMPPVWVSGLDPGNDHRDYSLTRKIDLTESKQFFRRCADIYGKSALLKASFRMHRIMYMAEKAYSRFCTEELEMIIQPKRNDAFSTNVKVLCEQTDTSEKQLDILSRIVVSLKSKAPVLYHYDHSVLQELELSEWDANFPSVFPPPENCFSDRWDSNFPANLYSRSKEEKFNDFWKGKLFWVVKYKPVRPSEVDAEDEEALKDVVRHMQIEFSDNLDEQVGLIEKYYQWVLSLRTRRDELKMTEEEVRLKIRKLMLLIHSDKCIQFTHGLSEEAKATYAKACKVFIQKHQGMCGFLRLYRAHT